MLSKWNCVGEILAREIDHNPTFVRNLEQTSHEQVYIPNTHKETDDDKTPSPDSKGLVRQGNQFLHSPQRVYRFQAAFVSTIVALEVILRPKLRKVSVGRATVKR